MRIIGHRGARGEAPENTLGGFQYIHDLGIRAVEFDVRQLKDHELIIMHDDNMLRTTGIDQALYSLKQHTTRYLQSSTYLVRLEKAKYPNIATSPSDYAGLRTS